MLECVEDLVDRDSVGALFLVRAALDHRTAIDHAGERWAQLAVIERAVPWVRPMIEPATAAGIVRTTTCATPDGRSVRLARPEARPTAQ